MEVSVFSLNLNTFVQQVSPACGVSSLVSPGMTKHYLEGIMGFTSHLDKLLESKQNRLPYQMISFMMLCICQLVHKRALTLFSPFQALFTRNLLKMSIFYVFNEKSSH